MPAQAERPDVTVSIVNHSRRETLLGLLSSLEREAAGPLAVEVVVLDNASEDGSAGAVRERFPDVRLLEQRHRAGFGANHNRVIRETNGRAVLVLSHDAELRPGALPALAEYLDAHARVGVVAPRIVFPDGSRQPSAWRFPSPGVAALASLTLSRVGVVQSTGERPRRVDWAMGAALMLRRAALEDVGLFDEGYFMYSEETDLCLRLARAGWETHYLPSAVVVHHDSTLRDEVPRERIAEEWRSRHRYWRKHHGERGARAAALATGAQYVARAGIAAAANRVRPGVFDPSFPDRMRLHARAALLREDARGLRELADRWNEQHVAGARDRASWWSGEGEEGLRALLMDVWDPLGVRGEPAAADEYDALLPAIARQLERRVPPGVLAAHLRRIRTEELGMAEAAVDDRAAAEAVLAWYEGAREEREARA